MKLYKRCESKKNHLSMTQYSLLRHLLYMKVLPTSKVLKPYTSLSSTLMTNCFTPTFKTEAGKMYDELGWSYATFEQNVTK